MVTLAKELTGGTFFTREYAETVARPCLHIFPAKEWRDRLIAFLDVHVIRTLNVAGPRASSAPGIELFVHEVLSELTAHR